MTTFIFLVPGDLDAAVCARSYADAVAMLRAVGVLDFSLLRSEG